MENKSTIKRKKLEGIVMSDKMQKTIIVKITTRKPHPKYKKIITLSKRFKVHVEDDANKPKIGTRVTIQEFRPISKDKSWILIHKQ